MKIGIFKEFYNKHQSYIDACTDLDIDYEVIDLISNDWIQKVEESNCDGFLIRPSSGNDVKKRMFDERVYFIHKVMNKRIYPSFDEVYIYENKRNMAYWLSINKIPMPKTYIFYDKEEAIKFIDSCDTFPLVFKPNIGSAAMGISFIDNKKQAKKLINRMFNKWLFFNRGHTKWKKLKFNIKVPLMDDKQYSNILLQEKINVKYEWRGVKIGESYFAHKKLADIQGFHSGSGQANYDSPPLKVMDFIKRVCDTGNFNSMNVDFFEDFQGNFYVNELQTVFGSKIKDYQMCVDGKPGRYIYSENQWYFEEGMFNQNNSYNLRVQDFVKKIQSENTKV